MEIVDFTRFYGSDTWLVGFCGAPPRASGMWDGLGLVSSEYRYLSPMRNRQRRSGKLIDRLTSRELHRDVTGHGKPMFGVK